VANKVLSLSLPLSNMSTIRLVALIELRLVTDRRADGHRAIANTALAQRRAGKNVINILVYTALFAKADDLFLHNEMQL